ncbi:MAG: response regulator [Anaerolineales bacterium]
MEFKVLVAEDEADMLWLISRRVENLGHRVQRANDGDEAMRLILRNAFDLVVTDINMPGATGLDLLAEVKSRDPYSQVIIVTANASMENAIEALNRGAFSYLTKPFDHISVISNAVERALEYRRLQLDNMRMAEAQRRRGDLLEDEVTDRVRQLSRQEQAYRQLLANLPQGIVVVSSNGRYLPRNPAAERWLARDERSQDRPIRTFLEALAQTNGHELRTNIKLFGRELHLRATAISANETVVERLVTIEDTSEIKRALAAEIEPVILQMNRTLNRLDLNELANGDELVEIARQVQRLQSFTHGASGKSGHPGSR